MKPQHRTAWIAALLLATALTLPAAAQETKEDLARERTEHSLALAAKLLCSGVFVIGRDPGEFIRNDLQQPGPGIPPWDDIDVAIDRGRKSVTLTVKGAPPRTAVFNEDQGCTLLPSGQDTVSFKPVSVASNLPDPATQDWPTGDRLRGEIPQEVDQAALAAALDHAFDDQAQPIPQNTRAIVVLYKGQLIAERYAPGFTPDTRHIGWSMGKSITSALIGILIGQGHLRLDDPAPIPQWSAPGDPRAAIRIADLLRMSSGLKFHTGALADGLMFTSQDHHRYVYFGATDVFQYSIDAPLEHPPSTKWGYRNCDPLILGKIIRDTVEALGQDYLSFPQRALFDPIGIRNTILETDINGNFIMTGFDYGTARDWARFGLLHLQDGMWEGKRILPEGWVDYIRMPAPASLGQAYGGLFWLNKGKRYKALPEDTYWPSGFQGQVVLIVPSRQTVIVRLGHSTRGGFDPYIEALTAQILAALPAAKGRD